MFTKKALREIHERSHRSLEMAMAGCRELTAEEVDREIPGFGYGTVRLQIHHAIGAQLYWLSVLQGAVNADDDEADFATVRSLEKRRIQAFDAVAGYIQRTGEEILNTEADLEVYGGDRRRLIPALVLLRTQTHFFHHIGQVTAMCRILGKPVNSGADFPMD